MADGTRSFVVLGGAGAIGRVVARDLFESHRQNRILIADFNESSMTSATMVSWIAVVHFPRKLGGNWVWPVCKWMTNAARAINRSRLMDVTVNQIGI